MKVKSYFKVLIQKISVLLFTQRPLNLYAKVAIMHVNEISYKKFPSLEG